MTTSSELSRLTQELQSLKSNLSQQFKESQEKFRIQSDLQKSELSNLKDSAKHLVEENQLLQEHLKNSDNKIIRLEKENEELMRSLEQDSEFDKPGDNQDDFQFQVASLNEKIKNLHALLKAEKLKTLDALREKSDIAEIAEMTQKTTENKISIILSEIFQEKAKRNELKEQLESRSKVVQSADLENLAALNDHLNVKQRTIENLIHEKETLIELLQFEREEKKKLKENKLNNRVVRQPLTSIQVLNSWTKARQVVQFFDDKFQSFTDSLEVYAAFRGIVLVYIVGIHLVLLVHILGTASGNDFLPS